MNYQKKIQSTNKQIIDAFLSLLRTKTIAEITINDIATAANIHRGTFYRHYVDKYALLEGIQNDFMNQLDAIPGATLNPEATFESVKQNLNLYINSILVIIDKNNDRLQSLMSDDGDQSFKGTLKNHLANRIKHSLPDPEHISDALDMAIDFICAMDVAFIEYRIDHPDHNQQAAQETFLSLLTDGPLTVLLRG